MLTIVKEVTPMDSSILHRTKRAREQAATLICLARTRMAETLNLQGRLFQHQWRLLLWKLHYRYVLQNRLRTKNNGSSSTG